MSACFGGKNLCHQTRCYWPFTADTHRHQKTQSCHLPKSLRKERQARKQRIRQNSNRHRRLASPAIGHGAEQQSSGGAAEEKDAEKDVAVTLYSRSAAADMKNIGEQLIAREIKNLPLINIKNPARRRDRENKPLE